MRLPEVEPLPPYVSAAAIRMRAASRLRPPIKISVSEAAAKSRFLKNPGGGYSGPWKNEVVPYLVEPMNMIASRQKKGVILAGPAQCGKTDAMIVNPIVYSTVYDPADLMVVQTSEYMARDFSKRRIDRLNRDSLDVGAKLSPGRSSDNVYDKFYQGMILSLAFPTINQLSGRPIPRIFITDYDRIAEDIDGEGSAFDLSEKRAQTFGSRGTIVAESSPGKPLLTAKWKASSPHEAPPAGGILSLYNRGDRRRYVWQCPHCGHYFEGAFERLAYDDVGTPSARAATVVMVCPESGCLIEPRHRPQMYKSANWLPEGCRIDDNGVISGEPRPSEYASYWLKGPAAAFSSWGELVRRYLVAQEEFKKTGKEEALKTTINVDQAEAYIPAAARHRSSLEADSLVDRAENYALKIVPKGARFLTAAVDVQGNRFDVLVRAWGPDLESWVIDYFKIFQGKTATGDDRPLDPGVYPEDWLLLIDQVIEKAYRLEGGVGEMTIAKVAIDSAGGPGVTANAYAFHRKLKRLRKSSRVILTKGASASTAPRVAKHVPDSKRKDRKAIARGEVPVYFFNPNMLKDEADAMMRMQEVGPRYLHFPADLKSASEPHEFFEMLTAEERDATGKWHKIRPRNEAFDLVVLSHVCALVLKADRVDWQRPVPFAAPWENNSLVTMFEDPAASLVEVEKSQEIEAPVSSKERPRRRRRSRSKLWR